MSGLGGVDLRIGVIADVHGNVLALEAVLAGRRMRAMRS